MMRLIGAEPEKCVTSFQIHGTMLAMARLENLRSVGSDQKLTKTEIDG